MKRRKVNAEKIKLENFYQEKIVPLILEIETLNQTLMENEFVSETLNSIRKGLQISSEFVRVAFKKGE